MSEQSGEPTMKLDDLSADELNAIDQVCLEFERRFGTDRPLSIDQAVTSFAAGRDGEGCARQIELLRQELRAVEEELRLKQQQQRLQRKKTPTPFQSKTGEKAGDQNSVDTEWVGEPLGSDASSNVSGRRQRMDRESGLGLAVGGAIGPYAIGQILARGGMGIVYRAIDTRLDRTVAIKMMGFPNLDPSDPRRIELVERFEREAKAVAGLSHPNIVELFDVGVAGGVPYAVMEFLSGVTLADALESGPLSAERTCEIGMQIAGALATAHASAVIHRDLKPQNVMLVESKDSGKDSAPRVKLVDFGLSRVGDSSLSEDDAERSSQTRWGMILGTPGYMAPEQARGESATSAADMFGFGCVLYEMFYGKPAIPGATPADRLAETLNGQVLYDHEPCAKSQMLCSLIAACLSKDAAARPAATDVYARLRKLDWVGSSAIDLNHRFESKPSTEGPLRRHVLTTLAGGMLGGLLGGWSVGNGDGRIGKIGSLAVLTLRDANDLRSGMVPDGLPLADRTIADGDTLAAALVNELSAVDGLAVLPYRPQTAETPEQFKSLGLELGVDAFVTGTFQSQTQGLQTYWLLNWQLVSAVDGRVLVGRQFVTEQAGANPGGQFLAQSAAASDIAKQIGRALVTSVEKQRVPDAMAYGCMMKGHAYADADSTLGLERALLCFEKAHAEDPGLSEPLAAIAVASLNLAARSDAADSIAHLEKARSSMTEALEKNPYSVEARLAEAMLEWQSLHHYDQAERLFEQLRREGRFNFQIQHQHGLFLAALGRSDQAVDALRTAAKLNPMSMLIKTDRCRVDWFFGFESRAIRDVTRYRQETAPEDPAIKLAVGLLIDYYEQQQDFERAARQQGFVAGFGDARTYFQKREFLLREFPYGPFGTTLNHAIFELRAGATVNEELLGVLNESGATMFPLLLAQHPSFHRLRESAAAASYLPQVQTSLGSMDSLPAF